MHACAAHAASAGEEAAADYAAASGQGGEAAEAAGIGAVAAALNMGGAEALALGGHVDLGQVLCCPPVSSLLAESDVSSSLMPGWHQCACACTADKHCVCSRPVSGQSIVFSADNVEARPLLIIRNRAELEPTLLRTVQAVPEGYGAVQAAGPYTMQLAPEQHAVAGTYDPNAQLAYDEAAAQVHSHGSERCTAFHAIA
jgi:hypothetical protein